MRVLLIKMSSMGDIFHTFPALTDAMRSVPGLTIDWLVEEDFAEIPSWHPIVKDVLPIGLRRWRKHLLSKKTRNEVGEFFRQINLTKYDLIIDAQGLLKSSWVAKRIQARTVGFDWYSAREPLASWFYSQKFRVSKDLHAITRIRHLFAHALNYPLPEAKIDYALNHQSWLPLNDLYDKNYVVCLHGTTWITKYWPEEYWQKLITKLNQKGFLVVLPWGSEQEKLRSISLAEKKLAWCPEYPLSLSDMARLLKFAKGVVSVDTGLSHVAASLGVPMVVMYRVTDPRLVGEYSPKIINLCSPLYKSYIKNFKRSQEKDSLIGLGVDDVFHALETKLTQNDELLIEESR
ncbi:MAG: lipopolysaccharide heptosyltransferase I [Methyloprofundus sp.]|nr:lipopolysaccharide heptosyltransferase I [Methyloprofundus sp.]